jgi:hypothetical protein
MEHVIPQWLIKLTGDPNRKIRMGINWEIGKVRSFSFSKLEFPACNSCNGKFSELESLAKSVIVGILDEESLSSNSFEILLSWFDKVRIGLWLGFLLLDKNMFGITPNFFIQQRINATDRMLLIYKTSDLHQGINFIGVTLPFFAHSPICFGLRINQFYFINISTNFLFSQRLGLPYSRENWVTNEGKTIVDLVEGRKHIRYPLIPKYYDKTCTEIYQPIVDEGFTNDKNIINLYDNDYVKKYIDIHVSRFGEILILSHNKIIDFKKVSKKHWIPEKSQKNNILHQFVSRDVISLQDWFLDNSPNLDELDFERRKYFENYKFHTKGINKVLLEKIKKEIRLRMNPKNYSVESF